MAEGGDEGKLEPGEVDARRYIATASGFLEILEIKPSSGRQMTWGEYVNGRHVVAGDMLVAPPIREPNVSA